MRDVVRTKTDQSLGEWACLGLVALHPVHGFAVAARLAPSGDLGRVWSMTRPNTYRCLDELLANELIVAKSEERGVAGGSRTILAATPKGRRALRRWTTTPVTHLREVRAELLVKLTLAEWHGIDVTELLTKQRQAFAPHVAALSAAADADQRDLVARWRLESSRAVLRFLEAAIASKGEKWPTSK